MSVFVNRIPAAGLLAVAVAATLALPAVFATGQAPLIGPENALDLGDIRVVAPAWGAAGLRHGGEQPQVATADAAMRPPIVEMPADGSSNPRVALRKQSAERSWPGVLERGRRQAPRDKKSAPSPAAPPKPTTPPTPTPPATPAAPAAPPAADPGVATAPAAAPAAAVAEPLAAQRVRGAPSSAPTTASKHKPKHNGDDRAKEAKEPKLDNSPEPKAPEQPKVEKQKTEKPRAVPQAPAPSPAPPNGAAPDAGAPAGGGGGKDKVKEKETDNTTHTDEAQRAPAERPPGAEPPAANDEAPSPKGKDQKNDGVGPSD